MRPDAEIRRWTAKTVHEPVASHRRPDGSCATVAPPPLGGALSSFRPATALQALFPAAAVAASRMIPPVQVSPLIKVRAAGGSPATLWGGGVAGHRWLRRGGRRLGLAGLGRAGPGRAWPGLAWPGGACELSEGRVLVSVSRSSPGTRPCWWG